MSEISKLPRHIYDYMDKNWEEIPHDIASLAKLVVMQGWVIEPRTLQEWCKKRIELAKGAPVARHVELPDHPVDSKNAPKPLKD